ncbi:N-acetyltransferase [Leptospira fletcheri]|uniref:N-acetyltransferase n=1 Tax=Leptospira fletcheri TaxID=2484981 RepID=A0A4R9GFM5_9LEPT|nr:GNAT family N-acetyltransferase [Leptospira fletcheri]TGK09957.1 N-acetyltransferase [Leptospira fletcheri]
MQDIILRKADISHIRDVFDLSNDPIVRENSLNPSFIEWGEHEKWFTSKIQDPESLFLIVTNQAGTFLGQVRFQAEDLENAVISISLVAAMRGLSFASLILEEACRIYKNENFRKKYVFAQINKSNIPSIKSFAKALFVYDSDFEYNNKMYILMKKTI